MRKRRRDRGKEKKKKTRKRREAWKKKRKKRARNNPHRHRIILLSASEYLFCFTSLYAINHEYTSVYNIHVYMSLCVFFPSFRIDGRREGAGEGERMKKKKKKKTVGRKHYFQFLVYECTHARRRRRREKAKFLSSSSSYMFSASRNDVGPIPIKGFSLVGQVLAVGRRARRWRTGIQTGIRFDCSDGWATGFRRAARGRPRRQDTEGLARARPKARKPNPLQKKKKKSHDTTLQNMCVFFFFSRARTWE